MSTKKPHHHGNLREALITAGLDLLEEGGLEALTLRKCAMRAGVSHAAPAHHFDGLISLQAAIVARGYHIFTETMLAAKKKAEPNPQAELLAICHGYLEFAQSYRPLFNLMFMPRSHIDPSIDAVSLDELSHESTAGYQVLRDACAPFEHGEAGSRGTETMIWSLVHGYATLFSERKTSGNSDETVPAFDLLLPTLKLK